jgi:hypothetical protein
MAVFNAANPREDLARQKNAGRVMRGPAFLLDGVTAGRRYCTPKLVVAFPEMPLIVPTAFAW